MSAAVILRCELSGALAPLREPRRMAATTDSTSFEARRKGDAHLRMTPTLLDK